MTSGTAGLAFLACVTFALFGCAKPNENPLPPSLKIAQDKLSPWQLEMTFSVNSDEPYCVSSEEVGDEFTNLVVTQKGKRIYAEMQHNRAFKDFKSLNAIDPVFILTRGQSDFWYSLADYPLEDGEVNIGGAIRVAECANLFASPRPKWISLPVRTTIMFRRPPAPHEESKGPSDAELLR